MGWRILVQGLFVLGVLVASPLIVTAQVGCGSVIAENAGLSGDLDCSSMPTSNAPALSIGANNITFRLNGHTLTCNSVLPWPRSLPEVDRPGIDTLGRSNVTILGPGRITGCGRAVVVSGSGVVVQGIILTKNQTGVLVWNGNTLFRSNVIVSNYGHGVELNNTSGTTLQANYIAGNNWGVTNISPGSTTFDANFILGNSGGGIGESGPSAGWAATLSNNVIVGNGTWTGGFDLILRDGNDLLTETICGASSPPGLCPTPLPKFAFDPSTATPPGAASLIAPTGTASTTPTFTWNAVASATWYYLWVEDSTASPKLAQWYTAAEAGCANGTGECRAIGTSALALGAGRWWVQTWNEAGYGPWSSPMSFTVSAPGQVTLLAPAGTLTTATPTYTWTADAGAAFYFLWVNDSTGVRITAWYTAAQANCPRGTGVCTVTPSTALANGAGRWWVQTWNTSGYGPWSDSLSFTVSP